MATKTKIAISLACALALCLGLAGTIVANLPRAYAESAAAPLCGVAAPNESVQDFHIDKDGYTTIHQVKVIQIAGTSFYVRYYIGLAFIPMLIKTGANTKVYRRFGDEITLNQIAVGDLLNVEGKIETGANSLSIIASALTDFSNQQQIADFTGTVSGISGGSLVLSTKSGTLNIAIGTTTQIKKGSRIITADLVKNGDIVESAVGTFDRATNILNATVVVIYIDKKIFAPRNFQGTLKSISGDSPTSLTVTAEGKDYQIVLENNAQILNNARKPISLKRYLEGDTIRVYGAIREAEEPIIDAEIVRNTSLK